MYVLHCVEKFVTVEKCCGALYYPYYSIIKVIAKIIYSLFDFVWGSYSLSIIKRCY